MRNTRTGRSGARPWTHKQVASALNEEFRLGVRGPRRRKGVLLHVPSVSGRGKWESVATLRRYKAATQRRREISSASRAHNRATR